MALLAASLLAGCSALNPISLLAPDPSLELGVQVGKENESTKGVINTKVETEVTTATTGFTTSDWNAQTILVQQSQEQPLGLLYLSLLIAGWVLPDPLSLWQGAIKALGTFTNTLSNKLLNR